MTSIAFSAGSPGVDITAYVNNATYCDDIESVDSLRMLLTPNISGVAIDNNLPVQMTVSGTAHFNGYIESFDSQATADCKCVSNAKLLARTRCCDVFSGAQLTAMAGSLITKYTTFDVSGIQTNAKTLSEFRATTTVQDAVEKFNRALGWQWYITPNNSFYLEPKGTTSTGRTLIVGSNCEKLGKWNYDISKLINKWTVEGKTPDIVVTEENAPSIGSWGLNENPSNYIDRTLATRADARQLAQSLLAQYKDPFTKGTLITDIVDPNIRAGRTIIITDSVEGISAQNFTVNEVTIDYGKGKLKTTLVVGTEDMKTHDWEKDLDRRIKELEESYQPGSPIVNITNVQTTIAAQEQTRIRTRATGSTFLLDHPKNGTLGTGSGLLGWCGSTWYTAQDWA